MPNIESLLQLPESVRFNIAMALLAAIVIAPFAINWWRKRHRPISRFKYVKPDYFGYGGSRQRVRLNRYERVKAFLRII